jgi:hypothetical protein
MFVRRRYPPTVESSPEEGIGLAPSFAKISCGFVTR